MRPLDATIPASLPLLAGIEGINCIVVYVMVMDLVTLAVKLPKSAVMVRL